MKNKKSKEEIEKNKAIRDRFLVDYSEEIELGSMKANLPEWVTLYRDKALYSIGDNFCQLCRTLKDGGVDFKVKYPVKVDNNWKFVDVYIPSMRTIVLLIQNHELMGLPCHSKTNREMFFGDRFKTLAIHTYEIHRVLDKLKGKSEEKPKSFIAFCDGSNDNNNPKRPAGAAYVILDENENELHRASKGFLGKTNNFVEMLAIISAVNWIPIGASVDVYSDSQYAINAFIGKFKAQKNLNLIERYKQVSEGKDVSLHWVKGHNGNYWNEVCDKMANAEYQKLK